MYNSVHSNTAWQNSGAPRKANPVATRRNAWLAASPDNQALYNFIHEQQGNFFYSMQNAFSQYGVLTDKQEAACRKIMADRIERKAAAIAADSGSQHVGTIGKRQEFANLTCTFQTGFETAFGYCYLHGFKDSAGNVIIYKGSNKIANRGDVLTIAAMVKAHGIREGVNQTIINRPKVINKQEAIAA